MAEEEGLLERVRAAMSEVDDVVEKRMFGGVAFMVKGKMCMTVRPARIMCVIDPAMHEQLAKRKGAQKVVMRGKEFKGYLRVQKQALKNKEDLDYWVKIAIGYNRVKTGSKK